MVAVYHHIDVQLLLTVQGVEVVTTIGFFHIHINGIGCILGGSKVVSIHHTTSQIVNLVFQIVLSQTKLVCGACNQAGFGLICLTDRALAIHEAVRRTFGHGTVIDGLTAIVTHGLTGVSGSGTGSIYLVHTSSGVCMLTAGSCSFQHSDLDALQPNRATGQSSDLIDILRCIQNHGHIASANSSSSANCGCKCACVSATLADEHDLGHAGMLDLQTGVLVETGGICIVGHIRSRAGLVIGNGNAVLQPYLVGGIKLGTLCLISKADFLFHLHHIGGIHCATSRAGAIHEGVTGSSDFFTQCDDRAAGITHGIAGVAAHSTGCIFLAHQSFDSMLTNLGADADAIKLNLCSQSSDFKAVLRCA